MKRRTFLRQSAAAGAAFTIVPRFVLGRGYTPPSDQITLGFIGLGKQTRGLANRFIEQTEAQILAGCDVIRQKRTYFENLVSKKYADARASESFSGINTYHDYKEMLERSDIDAIIVATPDHWHAIPSIDAMKAGKDVYCEKPLAHTVAEGRAMVKAARKYAKILQTGSMQRSWETFRRACELVQNGYIGKIERVLVNVGDPAIAHNLEAENTPDGVDWDQWCGPAPVKTYHHTLAPVEVETDFWPQWRQFKEYGGGILCDWGAHMFDIAQWGLGMDDSGPVSFTPPTDPNAKRGLKMVYENGIEMIHEDFGRGWGVRFIGTEGSIDISRQYFESKPEKIVTAEIKDGEKTLYKSENHYLDWLQAVKNRTLPICDVETGHRSASICNIANIAYELGRPLNWDPAKEKFKKDKEANKKRSKQYRSGYKI